MNSKTPEYKCDETQTRTNLVTGNKLNIQPWKTKLAHIRSLTTRSEKTKAKNPITIDGETKVVLEFGAGAGDISMPGVCSWPS